MPSGVKFLNKVLDMLTIAYKFKMKLLYYLYLFRLHHSTDLESGERTKKKNMKKQISKKNN